ncbi:hypothetical protein G7081_04890 [Vagococcus coleopterorum]|uniref:QacE family quaternary ammonium compound efflux SMR transporter n=1 Tax=Vagococcus coleopterorum TaxID=2714946 RepID=A0A6G8AND3_9ENTE|nr:multidrug efflux SMR transporter [Vagococcus coleopterorum]QIL46452.1 hypothetical protein G7081_04890 [Vagococcus coleopterorum]
MTKDWLKVVVASLFELVWVTGLAHATNFFEWLLTAIGVVVSFYLLTASVKKLPIGTVYAVFAGLGSIGSILVGVFLFDEKISGVKIFFMGTLLVGIIGLKLIESQNQENKEDLENIEALKPFVVRSEKEKAEQEQIDQVEQIVEDETIAMLEQAEVDHDVDHHSEESELDTIDTEQVSAEEVISHEDQTPSVSDEEKLAIVSEEVAKEDASEQLKETLESIDESQLDEMDALKLKISKLMNELEMEDAERTAGKLAKSNEQKEVK